ncbi:MBL fold metallo-hydrolase [uncultured Sphaerochaeta sp.]|uniref:MBL fold metallo-hydrolase n=1 Tax=uncultured Sphaerochaeta sp. TaxID=886478 RepID=UPI002A0A1FF2|nr:MBL fold metallo-hydrolase [uncultured Sphaerochaeta sp.]
MEIRKWIKKGAELKKEIDEALVCDGQLALWPIGQCGFIIKSTDLVVGIDLVLSDLFDKQGKSRRLFAPPFEPKDCPHLDYLCCSHAHADHLDLGTVQGVLLSNPDAKCIVSAAHGNLLKKVDPAQVLLVRQEEKLVLSSTCSLEAVAVAHENYVFDEQGNSQFLGFLFDFGSIRLFHSGDAILEPVLANRMQKARPLTILLLPINGRDERRHQEGIIGNMDAAEAISFARAVQAKLLVPTHFDMFAANGADPAVFASLMQENCPEILYHIPLLGEQFRYGKE